MTSTAGNETVPDRTVRADAFWRAAIVNATPVIRPSTNVQEAACEMAQAAGAHPFPTKPYGSKDVPAAIRSALDRGTGRPLEMSR